MLNKNNKKIILLLVLVIIFSAFTGANTFRNKFGLQLDLISQDPEIVKPGDTVDLKFRLQNTGKDTINNVKIRLEDSNILTFIGEKEFDFGDLYLDIIGSESILFYTTAQVSPNVNSGDHPISVNIISGISKHLWDSFQLKVEKVTSDIAVRGVTYSNEQLKPGDISKIKIQFHNGNEEGLYNFDVSLNLDNLKIAPYGSTGRKTIDYIEPNTDFEIEYELIIDPNIESKVYKIPFTYNYKNFDRKEFTENGVFAAVVSNPPSFILNLKETNGLVEENLGSIILDISNTGISELKFLNIKIEESEYYDIGKSQNEYIGNLDSDDLDSAEFFIKPNRDGDMSIKFNLFFKDDFNKVYNEQKEINVEVYNRDDAYTLGIIEKKQNWLFVNLTIFAVCFSFWLFMLINLLNNIKLNKREKYIWIFLLIAGNVVGAIIYYFIAKKT
ncbi:hypothetical protein HOK68_00250 [Candidatus Woesearchaeota archaeon]|jgi:hypothetical protein|nr:hypothetical protein [Candidatus Woesearchaeota archaeon]MBT4387803.1 hypothetical protein [Candidatus Woesearchaeota archaeon]MBT4595622.1 hypothetical protein [Candidatus Woesearchaeota archaeon]MBT5740895.1 hypothetical protein [Candidatus Woesearchaeota archaeon]MBT6505192.1 hypothetical protein [Candidatus Woesearchaeota archaeon]